MQHLTNPVKEKTIKRSWHIFDAKEKILGRLSTEIALKLMGKNKPYFTRNGDCGDFVVVINAKYIKVTGHKEDEKLYSNYSGYPGGLKQKPLKTIRKEKPDEIIRQSVFGMLPKNKLRHRMIARLYISADDKHEYNDKFSNKE